MMGLLMTGDDHATTPMVMETGKRDKNNEEDVKENGLRRRSLSIGETC